MQQLTLIPNRLLLRLFLHFNLQLLIESIDLFNLLHHLRILLLTVPVFSNYVTQLIDLCVHLLELVS